MRGRARRAMLWRRRAPDLQPHVGCRGEARGPLSCPAAGPLLTAPPPPHSQQYPLSLSPFPGILSGSSGRLHASFPPAAAPTTHNTTLPPNYTPTPLPAPGQVVLSGSSGGCHAPVTGSCTQQLTTLLCLPTIYAPRPSSTHTHTQPTPLPPTQVILSGSSHHSPPDAAAAATTTLVGLGPEGTAVLNAPGQAHPMRIYWEYLSYLLR